MRYFMKTLSKINTKRLHIQSLVLVSLFVTVLSQATVITVTATDGSISNDGHCSISEAIQAANTNMPVEECLAGDDIGGADTISIMNDIVLTITMDNVGNFGRTGTPAITTQIILEGNGFLIERGASLPCVLNSTEEVGEFRLLRVGNPAGDLDLRNIILSNGCADGTTTDSKIGGAVLNFGADLNVSNSIFTNNSAEFRGGGMDTTFGTSTVVNSYFIDNQTNFGGAGLSNFTSTTNISDSTFEGNIAGNRGGGVFNVDGASSSDKNATMVLLNNTFSGNSSSQKGGAIYNDNAIINNSHFNTLSNNTSTDVGGAIYNSVTGLVDVSHFLFNNNTSTNTTFECINDGGVFFSTFGLTDNTAGGCSATESASINLFPLANYGCMIPIADGTCIKTHRIDSNSAAVSNTVSNLTDFDQRGFEVFDGKRDIGAYQFLLVDEQCGNNQLGLITVTGNDFFVASVDNEFELSQAIICANFDDTTTGIIGLNTDITLSHQISKNNGQAATGTPVIDSHIVIEGNGFTLQRDLNFSCAVDFVDDRTEFRIFDIGSLGQLDLKKITLRNGCADSSAGLSSGGAVYNRGTLSIENSSIKNSHSNLGGGLANSGTVLSIINSIFIGNEATQDGGGIHNSGTISNLDNSDISDNQARFGGGIFNNSTITNLSNSTISTNQVSQFGGGIFNSHTINLIKNSTFSGNQAVNIGGGIGDSSGTILDVVHTTFSNNQAGFGGAVFVSNSSTLVNINNSLFHENSGIPADCGGSVSTNVAGDNNLSSNTAADNVCGVTITTGLNVQSVAGLADNGCKLTMSDDSCVKTHALLAQSEAINFNEFTTENKDQRGFTYFDLIRDAGAFEFLTTEQQCSQLNININATFTKSVAKANDLRQAINCANANNATTDSINFTSDIVLLQVFENIDTGNFHDIASKGRTGTPAITSPLIINGMGFSLMRDNHLTCGSLSGSAPEDPDRFRLLRVADTGSLELSNIIMANGCVSQNSQVHKFYGGGIYNQGDLSVIDSVFSNNGAATGGGIYNYQGTVSQISNSIFDNNDVPDFFGGGLANDEGQIVSIINNAFTLNNAFFGGGGIANINNGTIMTIARNIFDENNSVFTGAGLYNLSGAVINSIENNTFSGNTGSSGIGNESLISNISNSTFVNNDFGIHNVSGTINSVNNSLIDACLNQNGGVLNGSNNLSDDINHSCPDTTLSSNLNIDVNLSDNGCLTPLADGSCVKTHALTQNSIAIDAGDFNSTSSDQRGYSSINGRDIGAFEFSYQQNPQDFCQQYGLDSSQFTVSVSTADELNTAIFCANLNGISKDTITLTNDINLTRAIEFSTFSGGTGTFKIQTPMIINGQGFTLQRDSNLACVNGEPNDSEFGLLFIDSQGDLDLNNISLKNGCLLDPNYGRNGAGIFSFGELAILNTILENNTGGSEDTTGSNGGAIHNQGTISIIDNSIFISNSAFIGAGLSNESGTINTISNVLFSENNAVLFGGGIFNRGTITAIDSNTFSLNNTKFGGGIANSSTLTTIQNSTFSSNTALNGGGIYNESDISNINNNTFNGNSNNDVNNTNTGNIFQLQNSLIDSCGVGTGIFNGANNLSSNPTHNCPSTTVTSSLNLGVLQVNGCNTTLADGSCILTHALLANSSALDAAVSGTVNDQRGFVDDGARDIGAFEAFKPEVTAPENIVLEATGITTTVTLGNAVVVDTDENGVTASANNTGPFSVGIHTITWTATDQQGHQGTDSQTVTITDNTAPVINLNGDNPLMLLIGDTYTDPGAQVTDIVDTTVQITGIGTVNTAQVGSYEILYNHTDTAGNPAEQVIRTVIVSDVSTPVITLNGDNPMLLVLGETFVDPGAIVTDNVDPSVQITGTGSVNTNQLGNYEINYNHTDNAGNPAVEVIRTVIVGPNDVVFKNSFEN